MFARIIFLGAVTGLLFAQYDPPGSLSLSSYIEGASRVVSPGGLVLITGQSLAPRAAVAAEGFAESLAGVKVEVIQAGKVMVAPVASVSPARIVAQIPFQLETASADVRVTTALGSATTRVQVAAATPSPLTLEAVTGGIVVARHEDGRPVMDADAPAEPGATIEIAAAGLGAVDPPAKAGQPGGDGRGGAPHNKVRAPVKVFIGDVEAQVEQAILSPERAGEYLVRVTLPATLPFGWHKVVVQAGTAASAAGNRIYAGPAKSRLNDAWLAGPCEEASELVFRLPAKAWVRAIGVRARFSGAGRYELHGGENLIAEGAVWARAWETAQPGWRWGAFQWKEQELPAGEYRIRLQNLTACRSPEEKPRFGLAVEGGWMESLWSEAGGGVLQQGGEVSAPGIALTAEAGAFAEPKEIRILRYEETSAAGSQTYFRIEGLPEFWSAPLKVHIAGDAGQVEEGEAVTIAVKLAQDNGKAPALIRAQVEDGKLIAVLPPNAPPADEAARLPLEPAKLRSASTGARAARTPGISVMLWTAMGMRWTYSSKDHFIIHYPRGEGKLASDIGDMLEEAYELIEGMGLDWTRRKNWPMEVYLFSYDSWSSYVLGGAGNQEGNTESELWGNENVGLCLNLDTIKFGSKYSLGDARLTSGHELLHIMQSLYDPRGRLRKTFGHSSWLWLMEASATWFERAMAEDDGYTPLNGVENWSFLFQRGLEAPPGWVDGVTARRHGYGAAAFLQHLAPAEKGSAPRLVGEILKLLGVVNPIGAGFAPTPEYSPVRAIRKVLGGEGELRSQWHAFTDRYMQGEIWNRFPKQADLLRASPWPINVELGKTQTQFRQTLTMPELSASHYLIRFDTQNKPDLKEKSRLRIRVVDAAGGVKGFLYALGDESMLRLGEFSGEFIVEDAKGLFDSGQPMYLLLSNGRNTFSGGERSEVELTIAVDEEFEGVHQLAGKADCTKCYNGEYSVSVTFSVSSSGKFRTRSAGNAFSCFYVLNLENMPWSPEQPDAVDTYTVQFSIGNFVHQYRIPEYMKDATIELLVSTDGGNNWYRGSSGTISRTFHRGSRRAVSASVAVRPVIVYGGAIHILTGSGDSVFNLTITGLR